MPLPKELDFPRRLLLLQPAAVVELFTIHRVALAAAEQPAYDASGRVQFGHAEELLSAVLCIAAVLCALRDRPVWAAVLLKLGDVFGIFGEWLWAHGGADIVAWFGRIF